MKFNIRGQRVEVTPAIKSYVEAKIGKLVKYFENPDEITANVLVAVNGHHQKTEVTIPANKIILRAEEAASDLYASIDLVVEKLERQIRKNKSRLKKQTHVKEIITDYETTDEENVEAIVKKRKTIEMKPMSEEEAILQMNLLDHDFFVYDSLETNTICVVYKRKDGNYGIIETK